MDIGVGFKTVCAIESDSHCAAPLRRNGRGRIVRQADVRIVGPAWLLEMLYWTKGAVALLHVGPPSQPLIQAGQTGQTEKQGGLPDSRVGVAFEVARFAEAIRPHGHPCRTGSELPAGEGDRWQTAAAGVALGVSTLGLRHAHRCARRQRLRHGSAPTVRGGRRRPHGSAVRISLPDPRGHPYSWGSVRRAAGPLGSQREAGHRQSHQCDALSRPAAHLLRAGGSAGLSKTPDLPADVRQKPTRKDTAKFRRLSSVRSCPTLYRGETLYHPVEDRYVTPKEAARLQGFPDSRVFKGPIRRRTGSVRDLDQHRQVANAGPPPLIRAVASQLCSSPCLA